MKNFILLLLPILFSLPASAQPRPDEFAITESEFMRQAESDPAFDKEMLDRISLLDINSDNAISSTEKDGMIEGLSYLSSMTEQEKAETGAYIRQAFDESDADKNEMLTGDEIKHFSKKFQTFMIRQRFKKMDTNGDGVINSLDEPPIEESLKKLNEATEKLRVATEKLNSIPPKEMANNFIKNITTAVATEDYHRMDKNKDGCVTADEYADYSLSQAKQLEDSDDQFDLTRDEYLMLYAGMKKSSPVCLTMEEYVSDQKNTMDLTNLE